MPTDLAPVSIVMPILNEAATLPALLSALSALMLKPAELIFVDAGSRDASVEIIRDWWRKTAWPDARMEIVAAPAAYPGAARNAGIARATRPCSRRHAPSRPASS